MNRTVTVLAYNRPHYLKQCLEALAKCRGIEKYRVFLSIDGPQTQVTEDIVDLAIPILQEVCGKNYLILPRISSYGIDEHNFVAFETAFRLPSCDFVVVLEDDAVLTPDALELASWFAENQSDYLFMSLGDPFYRKEWPKGEHIYNELYETQSIYTSAWCFPKQSWEWMREHWNRHLNTQVGWDFSLQFAMWKAKKKALYPLVSRCRNIGREGVHSYPEFFDKNIAPAIYSLDQTKPPGFEITYEMERQSVPEWITKELSATEDRYAHLRNK